MSTDVTYQTYQSVGNREDLIDVITNIDPVDTLCLNKFGTAKAKATYHEYQTDVLDAPTENAVVEGSDPDASAIVPPVRAGNYTQILRKSFKIATTQESIDKAGRPSEINYQTQLKMKALSRDIEYMLVINSASASGASGTARKSKGLLGWITTNVVTASASTVDVTETHLNDALQKMWEAGGQPSIVLCGAYQKRKISAFTTNTRQTVADEKTLTSAVDIYQSDFGTVSIKLHQVINTTAPTSIIILGDMNLWKKAWLRPINREELAKTGSARKFMIEAELTLEARQEKGAAKMTGFKAA